MMKRTIIFVLCLVFLAQIVNAAEVCVVVDYGKNSEDKPDSKCVEIDEGVSGYQLIKEISWNTEWQDELYLCKVNDIGNDPSNCFGGSKGWLYTIAMGGEWVPPLVLLNGSDGCWNRDKDSSDGHYCTKDGDVLGLVYTADFNAKPDMFKINVSKVYVDGEKETKITSNGGTIRDVFPGSKIEFKIELENLYKSTTGITMNDVSIKATIEEIDDGDDIDEEISEFDLDADKKILKDLVFTIPMQVEKKDRLLVLTIEAKDDAGIKYEKEYTYDIEVEKEDHKLRILKADLDKPQYKCGSIALLDFSILNIGSKDENVALSIKNADLNLDIVENFKLKSDVTELENKYEHKFTLSLPENVDTKSYPIVITAAYGNEKVSETTNLVINDCQKTTKTEATSEEPKEQVITEPKKEQEITSIIVPKEQKKLPLVLIIILGILVAAILALLIILFLIRKR